VQSVSKTVVRVRYNLDGVGDGLASSSAGRTAFNSVLDSCLAQYRWRKL
jgi:hypothetical protein